MYKGYERDERGQASGDLIKIAIALFFIACPILWFCGAFKFFLPKDAIVVSKQAFFPKGLPSYLAAKIADPVKRERALKEPVIYKEYFDRNGRKKVEVSFPSRIFSKKPWYKIIIAERNGREHFLDVGEAQFSKYRLGQYMKKKFMKNEWIAQPKYFAYYDFFRRGYYYSGDYYDDHYYHHYYHDHYYHRYRPYGGYGGYSSYYGGARNRGYSRSPFGGGFRAK